MVNIHQRLHQKGFQIFAFPCNQFFFCQESGSDEKIKDYAESKFDVQFQMFSKVNVNGENTADVYKFLRKHSPLWDEETQTMRKIPWNFTKFLVDHNGQVVAYFPPRQLPNECVPRIEEILETNQE